MCEKAFSLSFVTNMNRNHQPKLIKVLNTEIDKLSLYQENSQERHQIVQRICHKLILNLATFGPILRIIHQEYENQLSSAKRQIFIESILRQKSEQKLSDFYENRSNASSDNFLSPRNSLISMGNKSKSRILSKNLEDLKEELKSEKQEKLQLFEQIEQLKNCLENLVIKYETVRDEFNAYKDVVAQQEDPVVLRMALNQSRRDFSKVVEKLNQLQEEYQDLAAFQ